MRDQVASLLTEGQGAARASGRMVDREAGAKGDNMASSRAGASSAPAASCCTLPPLEPQPHGQGGVCVVTPREAGQGLLVPCQPSDLGCLRVHHQKKGKPSGVTVGVLKLREHP